MENIDDKDYEIFNDLLYYLKNYNYKFITETFRTEIQTVLKNLYPNLVKNDLDIIILLTAYLIEDISVRIFYLDEEPIKDSYYVQWTQNNNRDILAASLMIIPFMDDKDNKKRYRNIKDLNQILYDKNSDNISKDILKKYIKDVLKNELKYTNFSIGLLDDTNDNILKLKDDSEKKLIYIIIHHHFCSALETIKITNGKLYINWINSTPIRMLKNKYILENENRESKLIKYSIKELTQLKTGNFDEVIQKNKYLWFGDYYNVMKNSFTLNGGHDLGNTRLVIETNDGRVIFDKTVNLSILKHRSNYYLNISIDEYNYIILKRLLTTSINVDNINEIREVMMKKYLKYKNKYLELKKNIR